MADNDTPELSTYHQKLPVGDRDPEVVLVEAIADLSGSDEIELPQLYSCVNEMVEHFFRSPPPAKAKAELTFSYAGYRITLYQDGLAVIQQLGCT